jgi:hypothetical protein
MISFCIIIITFSSSLGITGGLISLLIVGLIYFEFIPLGVFKNIIPENLTRLTSFDQAKKDCSGVNTNTGINIPFIGNIFGNQKGGGNFSKELKKISKKLQKIYV